MRCEKSLVCGSSNRGEFGTVDGAGLYLSAEYKITYPTVLLKVALNKKHETKRYQQSHQGGGL